MKQIVGGALFRDGKLLVVKRVMSRKVWGGLWEIPGGKNEKGESDEQALQREFFEETGIKIRVKEKYYTFCYDYEGAPAEENDYLVASDNYDVKLDPNEHTEFRWVMKEEAKKLQMSPKMKESVMKAFDIMSKK